MTVTATSILRINPTHSIPSFSALESINTGWITYSAYISLMVPFQTLMPAKREGEGDNY